MNKPSKSILYLGFTSAQRSLIETVLSHDHCNDTCITSESTNISSRLFNINECRTGLHLFESKTPNPDFERLYLSNRYKAIKIASRQQVEQGALSFDSLDYFINRLKISVNGLMTSVNPVIVYSISWPQCAFDFLVMLWCQSNGRKFIFEEGIPYFNRTVLMESRCVSPAWESVSVFYETDINFDFKSGRKELLREQIKDTIEDLSIRFGKDISSYVPGMEEEYLKMLTTSITLRGIVWIPRYLKNLASISLGRSLSINHTGFRLGSVKGTMRLRNASMTEHFLKSFKSYFHSKRIRKVYESYESTIEEIRNLRDGAFVITYFAAQEPESSILCGSGSVQSNLSSIELLLSILPEDCILIYKEHLSGLFFHDYLSKGAEPENRVIDGLMDFVREGRVVLAPLRCNKMELLAASSGVCTTIGNVGFEATLMQIPVLTLGRPWYFTEGMHFDLESAASFFEGVRDRRVGANFSSLLDHLSDLFLFSVDRRKPERFSFSAKLGVDRESDQFFLMLSALKFLIFSKGEPKSE